MEELMSRFDLDRLPYARAAIVGLSIMVVDCWIRERGRLVCLSNTPWSPEQSRLRPLAQYVK
jgi:hypothetical protein